MKTLTQTLHIVIRNESGATASAFVYNNLDLLKWVALKSFNLSSAGDDQEKDYLPPFNSDGLYLVRFTYEGGGTELASAVVATGQSAVLHKNGDVYYAEVVG